MLFFSTHDTEPALLLRVRECLRPAQQSDKNEQIPRDWSAVVRKQLASLDQRQKIATYYDMILKPFDNQTNQSGL